MTCKEYLNQLDKLDKMIQNKLSEIDQLRDMATSISVAPKDVNVQSSGDKDKIGLAVAKIVDLEHEVDEMVDGLIDKRKRIISQIESIEDANMYHVLHERYVSRKSWAVIEYEMKYEHITVMQIHREALSVFESKFSSWFT